MITETSDKTEIFASIEETLAAFVELILSVDESKFNTVPFTDSWTAGQLVWHVTGSTTAMGKAMSTNSKPADRDSAQRIPQLKKIFLDFSTKMKSPEFIVPGPGPYDKQMSIDKLEQSFNELKENASHANLTELVEGLPLGPITKLEILHFALYHTQRHSQQLKKIADSLAAK
ncbi:MAG TPA: DinB family protein [Chitinophagaceae bacterium]|nr:DinB family protein [Chitinophagaceae bacterium]